MKFNDELALSKSSLSNNYINTIEEDREYAIRKI
jgi:hypothetical protein